MAIVNADFPKGTITFHVHTSVYERVRQWCVVNTSYIKMKALHIRADASVGLNSTEDDG